MLPICRHKGIVAACERDGEKQQRVQRVAHKRGGGGRNPPRFEPAQFVEHENVHHLPEGIGGEAGQRDAEHEQIEVRQRTPAPPMPFAEYDRQRVGEQQSRQHHEKDDEAGERLPEDAHGQIGGEKDEGEGERAPCGMDFKAVGQRDGEGELHQIVAGCDDGDVEQHQPKECLRFLFVGKKIVLHRVS